MDALSRFAAALRIATASVALLSATGTNAQTSQISEEELFQLCQAGAPDACSTFLRLYPDSIYAPDVIAMDIRSIYSTRINGVTNDDGDQIY